MAEPKKTVFDLSAAYVQLADNGATRAVEAKRVEPKR